MPARNGPRGTRWSAGRGALLFWAFGLGFSVPAPANASDIRVDFMAIIYGVEDVLCQCIPEGAVSVGDTLRGFYVFASETPDSDPAPETGRYQHTTNPYGIVVEHENYVWATDPANVSFRIVVRDNVLYGEDIADMYGPFSLSNLPDEFWNEPVAKIGIVLIDETLTALSSDALPLAINLSDWPERSLEIVGGGGGWSIGADVISIVTQPTAIAATPRPAHLRSVYPNPFSSSVTVAYSIARPARVTLQVFDVRGRLVRTLVASEVPAGSEHLAEWDGRNGFGAEAASGVYFCVLNAGRARAMQKVVLTR